MKILLLFIALCCGPMQENIYAAEPENSVLSPGQLIVSFDFTRGGVASGQYAVWIENSGGELVRTLYVTRFTAGGGYLRRREAVPEWVKKADPSGMPRSELDAVSGATPRNGRQTYIWNGTDDRGRPVPDGEYRFFIEGTFYWWNRVLFTGSFLLGGPAESPIPVEVTYFGSDEVSQNMITDVRAEYVPLIRNHK